MAPGGRSISTACVGPSEALWHQKQLQWPSIAEAGGTKILDIVQAWYSMSSLCGEREVSQLFALKIDQWHFLLESKMFFCWDDMLHPLEDLALQFCFLLECNVLETAADLLPEHVKYICTGVCHIVSILIATARCPASQAKTKQKHILKSMAKRLNLNILALRFPWIPVSKESSFCLREFYQDTGFKQNCKPPASCELTSCSFTVQDSGCTMVAIQRAGAV